MRRMQLWALCMVSTLGLVWAAVAQTNVNPAYQMWSVWREGASATLKTESVVDGKVEASAKQTQTLKAVTADKAVVELTMTTDAGGMTFQMPPQSMEILAKVPDLSDAVKQALKNTKSAPQPASKSKETKGRETLTINGRALDCEWYQTEDEDGSLSKFWFCNDVPGRTVKVVAKSQGGTQTTVLVEWKGAKK